MSTVVKENIKGAMLFWVMNKLEDAQSSETVHQIDYIFAVIKQYKQVSTASNIFNLHRTSWWWKEQENVLNLITWNQAQSVFRRGCFSLN